jgi:hypothetical protein
LTPQGGKHGAITIGLTGGSHNPRHPFASRQAEPPVHLGGLKAWMGITAVILKDKRMRSKIITTPLCALSDTLEGGPPCLQMLMPDVKNEDHRIGLGHQQVLPGRIAGSVVKTTQHEGAG